MPTPTFQSSPGTRTTRLYAFGVRVVKDDVFEVLSPESFLAVTCRVYVVAGLRESVACQPPEPSILPWRCWPSAVTRSALLTAPRWTVTTTGASGRTERDPSAGATATAGAWDAADVAVTEDLPDCAELEQAASPRATTIVATTARTPARTTALLRSDDAADRCRPEEDVRARREVASAHDSDAAGRIR